MCVHMYVYIYIIGDHYWSSYWFSNKQHYLLKILSFWFFTVPHVCVLWLSSMCNLPLCTCNCVVIFFFGFVNRTWSLKKQETVSPVALDHSVIWSQEWSEDEAVQGCVVGVLGENPLVVQCTSAKQRWSQASLAFSWSKIWVVTPGLPWGATSASCFQSLSSALTVVEVDNNGTDYIWDDVETMIALQFSGRQCLARLLGHFQRSWCHRWRVAVTSHQNVEEPHNCLVLLEETTRVYFVHNWQSTNKAIWNDNRGGELYLLHRLVSVIMADISLWTFFASVNWSRGLQLTQKI